MSLLLVASTSTRAGTDDARVARALRGAARLGFGVDSALETTWQGGTAWWFSTPGSFPSSGACVHRPDGSFAAYVGSVHWKGLTRVALLDRLLDEFDDPSAMPLHDFSGGFACVFRNRSGAWLFNDAVGIQKIYETRDGDIRSTSMMVCRATLTRPVVDPMRAREYVLLGGTHSIDTPLADIRVCDPTVVHALDDGRDRRLFGVEAFREPSPFRRRDEALGAIATIVVDDFESTVAAFGSDIGMALSGGFDSRLILAALDRVGIAPALFVYGRAGSEDVVVAEAVAMRLGLSIESFDKDRLDAARPPLDRRALRASLAYFDGLPADGAFDRGADRWTRDRQMFEGRLNLNGGGGEILRNFFYLPDRRYSAADLVAAFYSNWSPQCIPDPAERRAFVASLEDGIVAALGQGIDRAMPLARSDVELLYSLHRLRFWMGRNNAIMAMHGAFSTPLPHPRLVALAAPLPLAWKEYGALEASLIATLSQRVAAIPSGYGFDFTMQPSLAYRLKVGATLYRPLAVRSRSPQLRRLFAKPRPVAAPAEWREAAGFDAEVDWIDARHLGDIDQLNRLMTLKAMLADDLTVAD